ncbi:MAG: gamma-glutamyltransferase [Acidobacteria bacterium]|nr:gamma-glutamyltransferase [Acidobacteriota bacterium]
MVTSASPLASEAGVAMLRAGGNAVDAAVATAFAIGVVEPQMSGLGGSGAATVWLAESSRPVYLDFYAAQFADSWRGSPALTSGPREPGARDLRGVAIPGSVAGLLALQEKHGALTRQQILAPAIRLADDGYPVGRILADFIAAGEATMKSYAAAMQVYFPGGKPVSPGGVIRNPLLADSLRRISRDGVNGFHRGPVAEAILSVMNARGHPATLRDFAEYAPRWKEPLCTDYRGHTVLSARRRLEVARRARPASTPALDPVTQLRPSEPDDVQDDTAGETTHISVVDGAGNAVALTVTNSSVWGSGAFAAGFFLNDSGFRFTGQNIEQPSRSRWRIRTTTIAPTIVLKDRSVQMVIGAPGAGRIPTEIVQVMVYALDYRLDPLDAVRMPRIFANRGQSPGAGGAWLHGRAAEGRADHGLRPGHRIVRVRAALSDCSSGRPVDRRRRSAPRRPAAGIRRETLSTLRDRGHASGERGLAIPSAPPRARLAVADTDSDVRSGFREHGAPRGCARPRSPRTP